MKRYKKFRPHQCAIFKKEMFPFCSYEEMYSHFKLLVETLILCQIVSHSNINFLISRQNKAPKIDPKMLKQQAGIVIRRHVLSFTQTNKSLRSNKLINKYLYCNELHLFSACSDSNGILSKFSCLVYTWFHLSLKTVLPVLKLA